MGLMTRPSEKIWKSVESTSIEKPGTLCAFQLAAIGGSTCRGRLEAELLNVHSLVEYDMSICYNMSPSYGRMIISIKNQPTNQPTNNMRLRVRTINIYTWFFFWSSTKTPHKNPFFNIIRHSNLMTKFWSSIRTPSTLGCRSCRSGREDSDKDVNIWAPRRWEAKIKKTTNGRASKNSSNGHILKYLMDIYWNTLKWPLTYNISIYNIDHHFDHHFP